MARKGSSLSASLSLMQCFTALALILFTLASAAADASPALAPVCRVYQSFTLWSAAGLVMCCGAAAVDWGDRVGSALGRLVLPCFLALVVWSAVYAAVSVLLGGGRFTLAAFRAALLSAARGDTPSHLWILYILLGLYLVTPILGRFARSASRGELLYFLVLAFLFAGLLPVWSALHTNDVAAQLLDRMQVHAVLGYAGCYLGGYYLKTYEISRFSEFALYLAGAGGIAVTFWGGRIFGGGDALWFRCASPNAALTAAAFFVLFRYVLTISEERSRRRQVARLGGSALGIYLIHRVFVLIAAHFGFTAASPLPAAVGLPVLALAAFLVSIPFAWLWGLLPWAKQGTL